MTNDWKALLMVGTALGASLGADPAWTQASDVVSPVVVTATLIPTPISEVGSSITLIDAATIEAHQWRDLPAALQQVPGVSVVQTGGPGGVTSVFIRGANSNHTKVLMDGIEVNDPSNNDAFDFGQALTSGVARIEVLRGPQSSLYGSDALGGVVNIVTPEGSGRAPAGRPHRGRLLRHVQPGCCRSAGPSGVSAMTSTWVTCTSGRRRSRPRTCSPPASAATTTTTTISP